MSFKKATKKLFFCGEQYWCVFVTSSQWRVHRVTSSPCDDFAVWRVHWYCVYSSQYRLWRQVMIGWMFIKYCLTFHNWIGDATPLPWQSTETGLCDVRRTEIPYLSDQQPYYGSDYTDIRQKFAALRSYFSCILYSVLVWELKFCWVNNRNYY